MIDIPENLKQYIKIKDLSKLPKSLKRYKCSICHTAGFTEEVCPICGNDVLELMCPLDHCHCSHTITEILSYCPICDQPMCPICGSHDVFQLSRVTGYIQDVGGWGEGKRQELKDRVRSNIENGEWVNDGDRNNG